MKGARILLAAVCALVIGVYVYLAPSSESGPLRPEAADAYYNLLVEGFSTGQLSLKKEVPPEFARLADPYDPAAHLRYQGQPYQMVDLSYYKGKLYLYFGITPALILFWPYVALTGDYLYDGQAVAIFCALGFLASVGLLRALWRRYFAEVNIVVVTACALALGLATGLPLLLWRSDVHEVAISCGYLFVMLALGAIWCALHEPRKRSGWLAAASVAYGLAVGARPSLLFGGIILLVPVVQAWRERLVASTRHERRQVGTALLAAMGPIALIGLGLMLYNFRRFDNPFEFGMHYQLNDVQLVTRKFFSLQYLWFNFRTFFLEPARWSARFPFVHNIAVPALPAGYAQFRDPFGVLTNIPLVWVALAAPLAWRNRSAEAGLTLRRFATVVALLFGSCALTIGLYVSASFRYEVEFLPALVWLAVIGILGAEHVLADRPGWRWAARCGWGLLLGFSVAFNLLATVDHYVDGHCGLGLELAHAGKVPEAIGQYEQALRINPNCAEAHNDLGIAYTQLGRLPEALEHWERAVQIRPDFAVAHYNLGNALLQAGKIDEAIRHYQQGLRIHPDYAEAENNLGVALTQANKPQEAIEHFKQALRIKPDYAETQCNFALALARLGRVPEAITHYEEALRIKPEYAGAHYDWGLALARLGRMPEAMGHWEQALRINPDYAEPHFAMRIVLEQMGRIKEAIGHYEEALRIKPGYTEARKALMRLQFGQ